MSGKRVTSAELARARARARTAPHAASAAARSVHRPQRSTREGGVVIVEEVGGELVVGMGQMVFGCGEMKEFRGLRACARGEARGRL